MTIVWNIRMICLELNRFFYDPSWMSWMLHLSEFRSSVLVVFNNFLLIDATYFVTFMYKMVPCFIFALRFWSPLFDRPFWNWIGFLLTEIKYILVPKICYLGTYQIIPSNQKRLFFAVSLYPLSFSRTLPLIIKIM